MLRFAPPSARGEARYYLYIILTLTVVVLLVGVIIAVGAFLAGPNPRAVAVRGAAQDFLGNNG